MRATSNDEATSRRSVAEEVALRTEAVRSFPAVYGAPAQLMKTQTTDPLFLPEAVNKRKEIQTSRLCVGVARVKQNGEWSKTIAGTSSGTKGPQAHAERVVLEQFVKGMVDTNKYELPFARQLNIAEGQQAGELLNKAKVTDIEVYTELPPCWGCDPWLNEVDNKITGEVTSRKSVLLRDYYNDYNKLAGIQFNKDLDGANALFDYHIHHVLGNDKAAGDAYNALVQKNYQPPKVPGLAKEELEEKQEALIGIILKKHMDMRDMEVEINAQEYFYILREKALEELQGYRSIFVLNNFEQLKVRAGQIADDMYTKGKAYYDKKQKQLDALADIEEEEYEEDEQEDQQMLIVETEEEVDKE